MPCTEKSTSAVVGGAGLGLKEKDLETAHL